MRKVNLTVILLLALFLVLNTIAFAKNPVEIVTPNAPAPLGDYSQGIRYGQLLFTAGQIGINPLTGTLHDGLYTQSVQVMENLKAILEEAQLDFCDVVSTTVYLAPGVTSSDFTSVYGGYFIDKKGKPCPHFPARSTITAAGIPLGALVEVQMIAGK